MLRTAQSLPLEGLLTLGFDAGRFPPTPPACYRAASLLPGRLAATRTGFSPAGDDDLVNNRSPIHDDLLSAGRTKDRG
jgi:hypothetical protein